MNWVEQMERMNMPDRNQWTQELQDGNHVTVFGHPDQQGIIIGVRTEPPDGIGYVVLFNDGMVAMNVPSDDIKSLICDYPKRFDEDRIYLFTCPNCGGEGHCYDEQSIDGVTIDDCGDEHYGQIGVWAGFVCYECKTHWSCSETDTFQIMYFLPRADR